MAKTTLTLPKEFQEYTEEELVQFLHRGQYDIEYRRARNQRLAADRKLLKKLRKEGKLPK